MTRHDGHLELLFVCLAAAGCTVSGNGTGPADVPPEPPAGMDAATWGGVDDATVQGADAAFEAAVVTPDAAVDAGRPDALPEMGPLPRDAAAEAIAPDAAAPYDAATALDAPPPGEAGPPDAGAPDTGGPVDAASSCLGGGAVCPYPALPCCAVPASAHYGTCAPPAICN